MRTCGQSETPAWLNVHRGSAASGRFDDHLRNAAISLQKLPVPQIVLTRFSAHGLGRMLEKSPDYTIFRRNVGSSGKLAARGAVCDIALIARRRQKNGRRVECRGPGYTARAISRSAFSKGNHYSVWRLEACDTQRLDSHQAKAEKPAHLQQANACSPDVSHGDAPSHCHRASQLGSARTTVSLALPEVISFLARCSTDAWRIEHSLHQNCLRLLQGRSASTSIQTRGRQPRHPGQQTQLATPLLETLFSRTRVKRDQLATAAPIRRNERISIVP